MSGSIALDAAPTDIVGQYRGVQRLITLANPAAGTDFSLNFGEGGWWRIRTLHALFTASAAVATRIPDLIVTDGVNTYYRVPAAATTAASTARHYSFVAAPVAIAIDTTPACVNGIPLLWLQRGMIVQSATVAIDVADQWSQINLIVEQLVLGPRGEPLGPHHATIGNLIEGEGVR